MSFTAKQIGGEYKHSLTTNEMPEHKHSTVKGLDDGDKPNITDMYITYQSEVTIPKIPGSYYSAHTMSAGKNGPHNNVQPFIVTYFWKRIK